MHTTSFLAIETCPTKPYYPVVCAWSLADGQVKTSLIQPAADWPQETCYGDDVDFATLLSRGHTLKHIMLEMNTDLDGQWVIGHSDYPLQGSFDHIAMEFDLYPAFEWSDRSIDIEQVLGPYWREDMETQAGQLHKDMNQAQDRVRLMQLCWARHQFPDTAWVLQAE